MRVFVKLLTRVVSICMIVSVAYPAESVVTVEQKVDRIERSVSPASVPNISGFIGTRLKANLSGYVRPFDIERYVRMVEVKKHREWQWIGEQPGKWLETAVLASEQSGDMTLREKARLVLERLIAAQEASGYLGVTDPAVRTEQLPLRGMDAYELYFMLHGLLTVHDLWGEEKALQTARRLGDYFVETIGPGKAEFFPGPKGETIAGHHVHYCLEGTLLADPMLRLFLATGAEKYLKWSQWVIGNIDRWSGHDSFSNLDRVADGTLGIHQIQPYVHSHTLHMNCLAFLRLYQITGNESLLRKVRGAWRDITTRQMYITGGVSFDEHYEPDHKLPLDGREVETCAMMSWIELSQFLLELTADPIYADAIERLLWNHLFAAQTIDGEVFRYHTPLNGTKPLKYFHGPDCCTASGPRITAKIPSLLYATGKNSLYINQFVDSTAEIKLDSGTTVSLTLQTAYPDGETIVIRIDPQEETSFILHIRLPAWCKNPSLHLNGKSVTDLKPGTYVSLGRIWKEGDCVTLRLPMHAHWIKRPNSDEDLWALIRGPVVYALDTVLWDESLLDSMDSIPENLAGVIGWIVEETNPVPHKKNESTPKNILGLAYGVTIALPNGKTAEVDALPFANVGRWYVDAAHKPDHEERRYAYAVWLPRAENR